MDQWVLEKKAEAMRNKKVNNQPAYTSGAFYTGQPVPMNTMNGTPFTAHRGEAGVATPEGTFVLNKRITDKAYPPGSYLATAQGMSGQINSKLSLASGGTVFDRVADKVKSQVFQTPTVERPAIPQVEMQLPPQNNTQVSPQQTFQAPTPERTTAPPPEMRLPPQNNMQLPPPQTIQTPTPERPTTPPPEMRLPPQQTIQTPTPATTTPGTPEIKLPPSTTTAAGSTPGTPGITQEDQARTAGLGYMAGTLSKTNDALTLEGRRAVDELTARQQQERSAYEQKLIQQGVDPAQARVEAQMLRNQQESDMNALSAKYGIAGMQSRDRAAESLAAQGLAGQQFEQQKTQYGNDENWKTYETALATSNFTTAAEAYKTVTGKDISMDEMKAYQNYINSKRAQDLTSGGLSITSQEIANVAAELRVDGDRLKLFIDAVNDGSDLAAANTASGLGLTQQQMDGITTQYRQRVTQGDIALESLRNDLTSQVFNSAQDMINKGASLAAVNQALADQGKRTITFGEYTSMRGASGLGQMEWERQLSAFNMLLQSKDPTNIANAAAQFSQLFPGVTFSADQLIGDIGAERFATGMATLSGLAAAFDSWGDAKTSADGLNLINDFKAAGMSESDIVSLFQNMKVNTIDAEWKTVTGSQFFKDLERDHPESADLIRRTFVAGLSGELEFDIQPVYNITDGTGKFVKAFDNVADANKYLGENADKGYVVQEKQNYVYKDMGSGTQVTVNNGTGEATTTGDDKPDINTARGVFEDSMANIPESQQPTYAEWKEAWEKAGSPSNYTYSNYLNDKKGSTPNTVEKAVEKYAGGWPTIGTPTYIQNTADRNTIWTEPQRQEILTAREIFMASPESVITVTKESSQDVMKSLYQKINDGVEKQEYVLIPNPLGNGQQITQATGSTAATSMRVNTPIMVDGYDSPFVMTGLVNADDATKTLKGIQLMSLDTGKIIVLNADGTLGGISFGVN